MKADFKLNKTIKNLILNEDYRTGYNEYIQGQFLEAAIDFFKKIVAAKLSEKDISEDWYKNRFLNKNPSKINVEEKELLALHAGLNLKTINNIKGSVARDVVIDFSNTHYDNLRETIGALIKSEKIKTELKLTYNDVSVQLDPEETMLVIDVLTVIRSNIRGGAWSSLGKAIEAPLMETFAKLLEIDERNYITQEEEKPDTTRETDFFFVDDDGKTISVEIKLMGRGNPESADGAIARNSEIFFAYKLSESNKRNLTENQNIHYVEFSSGECVDQLQEILNEYNIDYSPFEGSKEELSDELDEILDSL